MLAVSWAQSSAQPEPAPASKVARVANEASQPMRWNTIPMLRLNSYDAARRITAKTTGTKLYESPERCAPSSPSPPLRRGMGRGGTWKSETRSPKAEIRSPKPNTERGSGFGLRVSACFRPSTLGLRVSSCFQPSAFEFDPQVACASIPPLAGFRRFGNATDLRLTIRSRASGPASVASIKSPPIRYLRSTSVVPP